MQVQSPGVLWWRAQLRRRNAAVERINKPILGAQIFAFAITFVLAVGFVVFQATHGVRWLSWFGEALSSQTSYLDALRSLVWTGSDWSLVVVVAGAIAVTLMGGIVVYLASDHRS